MSNRCGLPGAILILKRCSHSVSGPVFPLPTKPPMSNLIKLMIRNLWKRNDLDFFFLIFSSFHCPNSSLRRLSLFVRRNERWVDNKQRTGWSLNFENGDVLDNTQSCNFCITVCLSLFQQNSCVFFPARTITSSSIYECMNTSVYIHGGLFGFEIEKQIKALLEW